MYGKVRDHAKVTSSLLKYLRINFKFDPKNKNRFTLFLIIQNGTKLPLNLSQVITLIFRLLKLQLFNSYKLDNANLEI